MKQGLTLVGVLIAVAIMSVSIVAIVSLQVRIVRFRGEVEYATTANLLATEPLELARAVYIGNRNEYNANPRAILVDWKSGLRSGTYAIDYDTFNTVVGFDSSNVSTCTESSLNDTCRLYLDSTKGFVKSAGNALSTSPIYRFVTISENMVQSERVNVVTTVVVVVNGRNQVYKGYTTIYNVDLP